MIRFTSRVVFAKQPVLASYSAEVGTNDHEVDIIECLLTAFSSTTIKSAT